MRCTWLVLVAVGCGTDATHPGWTGAPWTSGSRIRAQVYQDSSGEVVGFAGRYDTQLDWSCPVDDVNTPAITQCPPQAWWYYRAFDCSVHDVVRGRDGHNVVTRFAVASENSVDHYFKATQPTTEPIVDHDAMGTCTIAVAGPNEYLVAEIQPAMLALGQVVVHPGYSSLETDDGFQVILSVDGGQPTTRNNAGRIATMLSSANGLSSFAGMLDTTTGERCFAVDTEDGALWCLPQVVDEIYGPVRWAWSTPDCSGTASLIAYDPILTTVDMSSPPPNRYKVMNCKTPATMYGFQAGIHCNTLPPAYQCLEIPIGTFEPLTRVTE